MDPETGRVDLPPHAAISYAACAAEVEVDDETGQVRVTRLVQCFDVGKAINPTLVEGQIEGGALQGLGLGVLESCYPYYPSVEHRGSQFGSYLAPGMEDLPQVDTLIIENPSAGGPVRREGDRRDGEQPAAARDRGGGLRRRRRLGDGAADHARARPARARREAGAAAGGKLVAFDEELSVNAVSDGAMTLRGACLSSPFRTWNGVEPHPLFPGVGLRAVGGEQVLLCHVTYEPGHDRGAARARDGGAGDVDRRRVADDDRRRRDEGAGAGDLVVVNRGVEHELHSADGVTFVEALAPVLRDHVPEPSATSSWASRATRCTPTGSAQPRIGARSGAPAWSWPVRSNSSTT